MLDICLLGPGGMMPLPGRWLTALMARYNGKTILFDCGEGTQIPIRLSRWSFKSIDAIFFTHYHADHIAGLPGLLLTIGNSGRVEPLNIYGPAGLQYIIKGITVIAPELPYEIKLIDLPEEACSINISSGLKVDCMPADHSIPCFAYNISLSRAGKFDMKKAKENAVPMQFWSRMQKGEVIDHQGITFYPEMVLGEQRKGLKVSYCTDTRPIYALIDFASDSDLLVCEGMYGEDDKQDKAIEKKHMTFSEAAALAKESKAKELWLTHFSPSLDEPEMFLENAKSIFGNTSLGCNLMTKTLFFED